MVDMEKDNKDLRVAMLKKRYAILILKSQQEVLVEASDGENMKKKAKLCDEQLEEDKSNSQLERDRKAARIAIESIKRTVNFDDALQAERDFLAIIGATRKRRNHTNKRRQHNSQPASLPPTNHSSQSSVDPPEANSLPSTFPPQLTSLQSVVPPQRPSLPPDIFPLSTSLPPYFFSIPPTHTNTSLDNNIVPIPHINSSLSSRTSQNSSS
ncbi:hypothetical protein RDI58_001304 [Solanum bulbocastanum]|uniref:Uncharacterized protein n=1 Tax=Solanum bulbocastanum TaxID=147425 RepID=A0AAN8YPV2_SOLBU